MDYEKNYASVEETAKVWNVSERSVRNYCSNGRVQGSFLEGKTWKIPTEAKKPQRSVRHSLKPVSLLKVLQREKEASLKGGVYHKLQVELTYNSNHMEGSRLTQEQTRFIFETKTIGATEESIKVDDLVETINHFRCVDFIINSAKSKLTEGYIKQLHGMLKSGTSDEQKPWFKVGDYKLLENEVVGRETTKPQDVAKEMKKLLCEYNAKEEKTFDDILDFHVRFEEIHPFQDGNGRVGRLVAFKECLKAGIVPFVILDSKKMFYYRGLAKWHEEPGWLRDTCLDGQDYVAELIKSVKVTDKCYDSKSGEKYGRS